MYYSETQTASSSEGRTALCGGVGGNGSTSDTTKHAAKEQVLKDFVEKTLLGNESKNWPTSSGVGKKDNDNANAVATDLVALNRDEKTIVAGLLAKTIEGGEVVEIRAVSSTSVMVNACYDLLSEGLGVVPYACVGLGGNFVGVVDGHITPKLAYRLKAGLSYQLSPEISAFAGGFYHRVVGDGVYDDLPAQRLVDDTSPAGRTKDTAIANFSMAYVGGEFGVRFAF
ncbi:surface antigen family protein [Anaplasma phagocytophilum str. ApMUC09]|uniref:Surface antigen family protein n=1 Tax=Anaplasma phagocytophilum str. ApMUC09 TaxID=1359152 RepID=A0A0F3N6K8_ANAPH|nr:surface antigen family protein [Anaplasma phagocytophilum str. ApMUC09]SCV64579.1 Major surface antigen 4 precursor [Anaplasma phagocytophilum]